MVRLALVCGLFAAAAGLVTTPRASLPMTAGRHAAPAMGTDGMDAKAKERRRQALEVGARRTLLRAARSRPSGRISHPAPYAGTNWPPRTTTEMTGDLFDPTRKGYMFFQGPTCGAM